MIDQLWFYRQGQPAYRMWVADASKSPLVFPILERRVNETKRDFDERWKREYHLIAVDQHEFMDWILAKTYMASMWTSNLSKRKEKIQTDLGAIADLLVAQRHLSRMVPHISTRPTSSIIEVSLTYCFAASQQLHQVAISPLSPSEQ